MLCYVFNWRGYITEKVSVARSRGEMRRGVRGGEGRLARSCEPDCFSLTVSFIKCSRRNSFSTMFTMRPCRLASCC